MYDANLQQESLYIASAYIAGTTLENVIEENRPGFRDAAEIVRKLATALAYAHSQGIVHRDVKPANVMIDKNGEPLLMDFGLALLQENADRLTGEGVVLGTPAYMSPEQATGEIDKIGPATDQYSLGVVLYELLCGKRPFHGPPALVVSLVMRQQPSPPTSHNRWVPKELSTICMKAISKQPKQRYRDCQTLANDLEAWLNDLPISARKASPPAPTNALVSSKTLPVAALSSGILALLVCIALVATLSAFRLDLERRKTETKAIEAMEAKRQAELKTQQALAQSVATMRERERADKLAVKAIYEKERADERADAAKTRGANRLPTLLHRANESGRKRLGRTWGWPISVKG